MDAGSVFYPLLVIVGLIILMLIVGVLSSYFWLVSLDKRGRTCPNCGKRGSGKHLGTDILDTATYSKWGRGRGLAGAGTGKSVLVEVTEKEYEDHFECEICGHQWSKTGREITQTPIETEEKAPTM